MKNKKFQDLLIKQVGEEIALLAMWEMLIQYPNNEGINLDHIFYGELISHKCLVLAMFSHSDSQQGNQFWRAQVRNSIHE